MSPNCNRTDRQRCNCGSLSTTTTQYSRQWTNFTRFTQKIFAASSTTERTSSSSSTIHRNDSDSIIRADVDSKSTNGVVVPLVASLIVVCLLVAVGLSIVVCMLRHRRVQLERCAFACFLFFFFTRFDLTLLVQPAAPVAPSSSLGDSGEIFIALASNDVDHVRRLLERGELDVNRTRRAQPNWSPLHFTACYGQLECARLLLQHGADINALDSRGYEKKKKKNTNNARRFIDIHVLLCVFISFTNHSSSFIIHHHHRHQSIRLSVLHRAAFDRRAAIVDLLAFRGARLNVCNNFR
jgi:hypothetical protein